MPVLLTTLLNGGVTPGVAGTGARVSYSLTSYNTANSVGGSALFDSNFANSINAGNGATYQPVGTSVLYFSNSTNQNYQSMFNSVSDTSTSASSNSTSLYLNATNSSGEFGNAAFDIYSDGTYGSAQRSSGTPYNKHYLNSYAINSDHSNKRYVYLLASGTIYAVDRLYGNYNYPVSGTSAYTVTSLNTSMQGSASYNYARKELTILSYNASGGSFNVITFQNVDFNLYPDPSVALTQGSVVRVNSTVSLASNWSVNNSESYYNLKPIVTSDGTVFVSVMFQSNSLTLYKFTRSGTSAITATYLTALSTTTAYGLDQGFYYGQRQITSRDGTSVATFCPYYYYGSGIECFMIDKTNNTYSTYNNNTSGYGYQIVPFQNNGWAFSYSGNCYAGNYGGGYISAIYTKNSSGGFTQTGTTLYYPQFPHPNTTNYPGLTQVTDYMLLSGNLVGPKLAG
jgi:hypothetical protein